MVAIKTEVQIDGVKYTLEGDLDFSNLIIKKIDDDKDPVDPVDPVDPKPVDPTTGTIKEGSKWSKDPVGNKPWNIIAMEDADKKGLFKIVDNTGLNVIADLESQDIASKLVEYFKTNPFPPKQEPVEPPTEPTDPVEPPVEPPTEPTNPEEKGFTKDGVQLLYVTDAGNISYDVEEDRRKGKNDGIRWNWNLGKDAKQSVVVGYFKFTKDPVDDEVSAKWSEMRHSGSNDVQCYDSGVSIKDGKSRLRFENPHPNYSKAIGTGKGAPLPAGKWIGYMGVKKVNDDGTVTIQIFQDTGDNETKPSNQWNEIFSHTDSKYKRTGAHPYVTIRVDDPEKKGQKNLEVKWLAASTF